MKLSQQNLKQKFFNIYFDFENSNSSKNLGEPVKEYKIQPDDTLSEIAKKNNTPQDILAYINQLPDPNLILAGDTINIPLITKYKVVPGDTLESIAKKYNTTVERLAILNAMNADEVDNIQVGTDLLVPDRSGQEKKPDSTDTKQTEVEKKPESLETATQTAPIEESSGNLYVQEILSDKEKAAGFKLKNNNNNVIQDKDNKYKLVPRASPSSDSSSPFYVENLPGSDPLTTGKNLEFNVPVVDKKGKEFIKKVQITAGNVEFSKKRPDVQSSNIGKSWVDQAQWLWGNNIWTGTNQFLSQKEQKEGLMPKEDQKIKVMDSSGNELAEVNDIKIENGADLKYRITLYDKTKEDIKSGSIKELKIPITFVAAGKEYVKNYILSF